MALLKGLICNWIEKARICLNACWYWRAPSGFLGRPNTFSQGSDYGAFVPKSAFASERSQVRTWGAKLASCPERHLTLLRSWHPGRLIKQIWVEKNRSGIPGLVRKNAFHRNLKGTFEELLPCYCCAIKINSRTIP